MGIRVNLKSASVSTIVRDGLVAYVCISSWKNSSGQLVMDFRYTGKTHWIGYKFIETLPLHFVRAKTS